MGASLSRLRGVDADDSPTVSLWYIRRQLGRADYSDRRMVEYVKQLIDGHGFPKPYPCRRGRKLIEEPVFDSRWNRHAVDTWLHDFLPPDAAAALDMAAELAAAHEMDAAASGLRLVGGREA